jgi:hypothetical protein
VSLDGHGGAQAIGGERFEDWVGYAKEVSQPRGPVGWCGRRLRWRGQCSRERESQGGSEEIAAFHPAILPIRKNKKTVPPRITRKSTD